MEKRLAGCQGTGMGWGWGWNSKWAAGGSLVVMELYFDYGGGYRNLHV